LCIKTDWLVLSDKILRAQSACEGNDDYLLGTNQARPIIVSFASDCHDAKILLSVFLFDNFADVFCISLIVVPCVHCFVSWKGSEGIDTPLGYSFELAHWFGSFDRPHEETFLPVTGLCVHILYKLLDMCIFLAAVFRLGSTLLRFSIS
jgi:hypothetical protein